jgi:hypothetical protein
MKKIIRMLLLPYHPHTNPNQKPTAPVTIVTKGIWEETITDWYWNEDPLFNIGWLPKVKYNFDHPTMIARIKQSHVEQQKIIERRGYRYPHH